MTKTTKRILWIPVHILCWLVFLSIPTVFNPERHDLSFTTFMEDLLELPRWTNGVLLIILFYFNYYIAIPHYYLGRKYVKLIASFVGSFAVFSLLNYFLVPKGLRHLPLGGFG